ncbi:ADP-ribose diphosphatase [Malassezia vespertilionis]|uniref:Nudix hydrolase domain-containing protein n=1 Tax=Malassezia vespertilionis TaxID=2020962 RepID=A0A2N1JFM4_9BASI|nr:ADP-ribose diphosphatase [Malassezia vespertilionis]PKI85350.1 hypothetical protein MVES_000049 [Malassezia vespertilionis]WFD04729.1 ADP-ribose diphosphatase [Malassezia vespertilionis]
MVKSANVDLDKAKVETKEPLHNDQSKWIGLHAIRWVDPSGKHRVWECADRKTRKGQVDAVAILAIVKRPGTEPHVLLVRQFRPPAEKTMIELPAGLVDKGEVGDDGVLRAAFRELHEETGYRSDNPGTSMHVASMSSIMYNDPGLTGANMRMCTMEVDLSKDAPDPIANPDEGEFIERYLVPLRSLGSELEAFVKKGYGVDARLAHMAAGIDIGLNYATR